MKRIFTWLTRNKTKFQIIPAILLIINTVTSSIQAQSFIYSENFTNGATYCPGSTQYDNWGAFRSSLDTTSSNFISCTIKGSLDALGITCTDAAIVSQIAGALQSGTEQSFMCNGITWRVGSSCTTGCSIAGDDIELNAANTGNDCSCSGDYTIRPCIGNNNWGGIIGGSCGAPTQSMQVEFYGAISLDAGITLINSPTSLPSCNTDTNLYVSLKQFGTDTLTSADIGWSINGIIQPITNWTGFLLFGNSQDSIYLGSYPFTSGDSLVVWSTNPNSILDSNTINDTIKIIIPPTSLHGIYTIDANLPTAGNNFNSFADAIHALDSLFVCDTVLINVAAGTYNEQISIPEILGTDSTSPVIFRGDPQDSSAVILNFSPTYSTPNYTMQLSGTNWFGFEHITFTSSGNDHGRVIEFTGESENNWISNCLLIGTSSTSLNFQDKFAIIYSSGANSNNNRFSNNLFIGGSHSIYWEGISSSNLMLDNTFDNCDFIDWFNYGTYFKYNENLTVHNCTYRSNSTFTSTTYGLYLLYCYENIIVTNNKIERDSTMRAPNIGIYLFDCHSTNTNRGLVANNSIIVGDTTSTSPYIGMNLIRCNYQNIYHNTIVSYGGGGTTSGTPASTLHIAEGGNNHLYNNNIANFSNVSAYYAIYFGLGAYSTHIRSDNNNIYAPNTDLGYYFLTNQVLPTLQDWKNTTNKDSNSVSVNPNFYNWINNDLHVCNDTLNNTGKNLSGLVNIDFDGDIRDQATPDIGADEFFVFNGSIFNNDTLRACSGDSIVLSGVSYGYQNVWNTGDTTIDLTITTSSSWTVTATNSCGNSFSDTVVTSISSPSLSTSINNNVSCFGLSDGQVSVSVSGGTAPYTYLWSNNDTTSSSSGLSSGTILVDVSDINGCTSRDSVIITSPSLLIVSASVDNDVSCPGLSNGEVSVNASGGTSPYTYLWSNNETTATLIDLAANQYQVTVTDNNGCTKSDSVIVQENNDCTGLSNKTGNSMINYYPNPTTGFLNIDLVDMKNHNIDLEIVNLYGKIEFSERLENNGKVLNKQLNLSNLTPGVYFIKINSKNINLIRSILLK